MNCDPATLVNLARCLSCVPRGMQAEVQLYLLCQWANSGGAPPCTLPTAPVDLGASAGNAQVTLTWPAGVGATGYNIKRALVPGGPYTVIGTAAASPYVDHTAVNGTAYYYVVSSTNACGESVGNSIESHATPFAPFSYAPATSIITWTDINGAGQSGNLAFFNATANIPSVSIVALDYQALTSISNLSSLTALINLSCKGNFLAALDLTGCAPLVALTCTQNSIASLDMTSCPSIASLYCDQNLLTTLDVTSNMALVYLICNSNLLISFDVINHAALQYLLCNNNLLSSIDVTGCTDLVQLKCNNNLLTTIGMSATPVLTYLLCHVNSMTVLAINNILSDFVYDGNTGGLVNCSGQTPAAPPSVGPPNGIVAKAALLAEVLPWTVTTD